MDGLVVARLGAGPTESGNTVAELTTNVYSEWRHDEKRQQWRWKTWVSAPQKRRLNP